jgi:uncharacterized protein (AIM24 family)
MINIDVAGESKGIELRNSGTLNNNLKGIISITNANLYDIELSNISKLNNYGEINLLNSQTAIKNSRIINNDNLLLLQNNLQYGIDNQAGSSLFTNNGIIDIYKLNNSVDLRNINGASFIDHGDVNAKF